MTTQMHFWVHYALTSYTQMPNLTPINAYCHLFHYRTELGYSYMKQSTASGPPPMTQGFTRGCSPGAQDHMEVHGPQPARYIVTGW